MHPSRLRLGPSQSRPLTDASPGSRDRRAKGPPGSASRRRNIRTHAPFRTECQSFLRRLDTRLTRLRNQRSGRPAALRRPPGDARSVASRDVSWRAPMPRWGRNPPVGFIRPCEAHAHRSPGRRTRLSLLRSFGLRDSPGTSITADRSPLMRALPPTPRQSGSVHREQGISQSGNPRLRTTMIQLAWLWLRHQPGSALTLWFQDRMERNGGRRRKTTIVALARKLLVALWKYVSAGVVIEGAMIRPA
jgi:hypothetical protein